MSKVGRSDDRFHDALNVPLGRPARPVPTIFGRDVGRAVVRADLGDKRTDEGSSNTSGGN